MSLFSSFGQGQNPTQNQGSSLFGASTTGAAGAGKGLFGPNTAQPSSGGGLFGPPQQQQPQQSGGLFGQPQQQQPGGGGGLFAQSTAQRGGGSLFGQPPQQQQTGGLFGQSQQQQQPPNSGLFGQSLQQQQQQLQPQQGGFGGSILGGSMYNAQNMQMQSQGPNPVVEKIQRVKNSWDPNHPDYVFRYYFYNQVGKERAAQFQKPPQDDPAAWEKAWAERPNDGCVPVRANGFRELEARVNVQEKLVQGFRRDLWAIQEKLNAIQNQHDLTTSIKLEDCRRRHITLARRALALAAKVQVLKNRGYALQPEEEVLKKRLSSLLSQVQDPATSGRMNEIWARMIAVQEKAKLMEESLGKVEIVWDEKQLQTAGKLLQSNAVGLEYLHKEVRDIESTFAQWEASKK